MALKFDYECVLVRQSHDGKTLLLFSASAVDIEAWIGIPQRLSLSGTETAGFQRTVSQSREIALREFFAEPRNVIQNPLLCAIRQAPGVQVTFEPSAAGALTGRVTVEFEDYGAMTLHQLLTAARLYLESRVPALAERAVPNDLIVNLQAELIEDLEDGGVAAIGEAGAFDEDDADEDETVSGPAEDALFDESQITEFWDQLRAREEIAAKLQERDPPIEQLAGFSREMLRSYLQPIILVDGQHRLRGATLAAAAEAETNKEAADLVEQGLPVSEARSRIMAKVARHLPISLLMDDAPAEHVFQYVLVNQKATPVPKALLGTIISTSLGAEELSTIAARLEHAHIPLEGSRIVSILSRSQDSPFFGLIAKGFGADDSTKLQWSVLESLINIFRYLRGAKFYHDTTTDHAATWAKHHLAGSGLVAEWQARDFASAEDYWRDLDGPWMAVFKAFWSKTRDMLADTANEHAHNYWGDPKGSNIFNKPMLHILATDFFSYLREQKAKPGEVAEIPALVEGWLEYASSQYFARDWDLDGVKKDSVGTRRQWSKLWATYRQQGDKPQIREYSKLYKS